MLAAAGGSSYRELLETGGKLNLPWELIRSLWKGSPFTVPSLGLAVLELLPKLLPGNRGELVQRGLELKAELVERIGPQGVMIFPPYSSPAPRHIMPLLPPFNWVYTAIINVMELPSTAVPLGLNDQGLPLGVQVVGIHDHDHVTVAVAQALERAFGGWVAPPR
jgi:fatty acid amide hydrolase 2